MSRPALPDVDYLRTSARPTFASLPDGVRAACADIAGAGVVSAGPPVGSGFTGAYAGLLTLADGRRVFAKVAGPSMPHVVVGLAAEQRVLPLLTSLRCPSRLLAGGTTDGQDGPWRVLLVEEIVGRQPGLPWSTRDADAAGRACVEVASLGASEAATVTTARLATELGADQEVLAFLDDLAAGAVPWPRGLPRPDLQDLATTARLARRAERALDGDRLVHGDVRPDNLLVEPTGEARLVDWNHATLGAPWVDLVGLWPLMAHHGVDVRRYAGLQVLDGVGDDDVDAFLAVLAGFMMCDVDAPPPPGCTAALRAHQLLMAGTTLALLAERRGWDGRRSVPATGTEE